MARSIVLVDWINQGGRTAADSVTRLPQASEAFRPPGVVIEAI